MSLPFWLRNTGRDRPETPFRRFGLPAGTGQAWNWRRPQQKDGARASRIDDAPTMRTAKMARVEAALFVASGALSSRKLMQAATLADVAEADQLVEALNTIYDSQQSAFRIEQVAAGYQLLTRPELSNWLDRVHHRQTRLKLTPPTLETLAIIAYRQPCTRADVETVRGVQSAEIIKQLMERDLVRVVGEDESLGRPYLYGTTRQFLEDFGLADLNGLPMATLLRKALPDDSPSDSGEESTAA